MAAAVGVDQFADHLGSAPLRQGLALILFAAGAAMAGLAYRRWAAIEAAMPFPIPRRSEHCPCSSWRLRLCLLQRCLACDDVGEP